MTPPEVSSGSDEVLPLVVSRVLGISGAVVLATALLERVRRGHERRATRAAALIGQTAPEEAQPAARAMAAAADLPLVRWAGQSLAEAMSRLDTTRFSAVPVAVELGDDGIKVLWDRPVSELPAPWTAQDGGWGWSLAFDEDAEVAADSLPSCIPALVTVGRRDRRALLVNLEAFGALGVSGPATRTDGLLRSMASELTLGEQLSDAYVGLVGVNPIADPTSQRAQRLSVSTALERVTATVNEIQQVLAADGCATSFSRRAGRSGIPLEVVAIIASGISPSDTEALLAAARPHCGVGVAVADQHGHCPTRIVINEDGYAVLYPLGIGFEPAHLPARTADEAAGLVIASEQVDFDERPSIRGSSSARSALPEGALLVKVLGTPRIDGGRSLGPRETSLIAYLACRERPATTAHIQEALWGGRPVQAKTIWNLISRARQGLGVLDSGKPAFPQSDQATRTFRLAPEVITDLELLRAAVACTEATGASRPSPGGLELDGETRRTTRLPNDQLANDQLPTDRPPSDQLPNDQLDLRAQLAAALGMVEGRPFDAPGYDWAFRDGQHAAEAADLIERASLRLAEMALRAEDHGQARWALATGLTGLPGNEPLYRKRMSIEAAAGNRAGVESTFDELCRVLVDLETVPSAETIAHRQRLREAMLSRVHH